MLKYVNGQWIAMGILGVCLLEIVIKGILSLVYRRLLRGAKDMGHSDHPFMKTLCRKFETCYKLQIGVPNVNVFVEKYLRHYRMLGFHLQGWESFCNACMLLSMLTSLGGSIIAMILDIGQYTILGCLMAGVVGNGLILLFDCIYAIPGKRELLYIDMVDFLENIYKPRLENETFHAEMVEEYQQKYFEEEPSGKVVSLKAKDSGKQKDKEIAIEFTKEEEKVIRDVIREYMG